MRRGYRPDIDGLRAIAVLSVVFYHFDFEAFGGGYVGVDIFFVISGFLITSLIVREINQGSFSIVDFYERRRRRILPAVVTVAACVLLFASILIDPIQFEAIAVSSMANNLFLANVHFYQQTGYFDTAAELKPLLHTWSLSVEEQYYAFFPLLLLAISKFAARNFLPILLLVFAMSFGFSLFQVHHDQSASFYLIQYRAWELMVGSILAISRPPEIKRKALLDIIAGIGVSMMIFSVIFFSDDILFPGYYAVVPTLGAAMFIFLAEVLLVVSTDYWQRGPLYLKDYNTRNIEVVQALDRLKNKVPLELISPADLLCGNYNCRVALKNGTTLYRDDNHLSNFGSRFVSRIFDSIFESERP